MDIRAIFVIFAIVLVSAIFAIKLFSIQIFSNGYEEEAKNNVVERVRTIPRRGMIYDRDNNLIVANEYSYELMVKPREFKLAKNTNDSLRFCEIFSLSIEELRNKLFRARRYAPYLPTVLKKQIDSESFAMIQDRITDYPGLSYQARTIRRYQTTHFASGLGFIREIDNESLEDKKSDDYEPGDLIGKAGIEASYEKYLRGTPGFKYILLNVNRVEKGRFNGGKDDKSAMAGSNLTTSIQMDLQTYGEELMQNKIGSIVAIEPETGEILALVSAPTYDPNLLSGKGREVTANYHQLLNDIDKPMFNRATMALYPPGSTIKTVQSIIAVGMGAVDFTQRFSCAKNLVKCHGHPSPVDIAGSIQYSCNPYYHQLFRRILNHQDERAETPRKGLKVWNEYMKRFGLGRKLNTDLFMEKAGRIPSPEYYDRKFQTTAWHRSSIYSLSIGQGEMGTTPLQMANIAAIIANRGYYRIPHIVKAIDGDTSLIDKRLREKITVMPDSSVINGKELFEPVVNAMERVLTAGTASRGQLHGVQICGKTGTAQNSQGEDHSVFIAFAPKINPKIAIAVYIENAGFGGTWAAPIASLMIEKYLKKEVKRKALEKSIIEKNFIILKKDRKKKITPTVVENLQRLAVTPVKDSKPKDIPSEKKAVPTSSIAVLPKSEKK